LFVIPAQAGIQVAVLPNQWIPLSREWLRRIFDIA
jgi:hypothetical protein